MSRFLSLQAFAKEVGWSESDVMKLVAEKKIKAYQSLSFEPYIAKSELDRVREMARITEPVDERGAQLVLDEANRVKRLDSRARIAADLMSQAAKAEKRKSALALKQLNRQTN